MPVTIDGSNTPTAGGVIYGDGTEYASTSAGTSGQSLLSAGSGAPTWGTPASATTATNLAGGGAGQIPYNTASGATAFLAAGTSGQVLQSNGTSAPSWATPGGGSWIFINSTTGSGASTIDVTGMNSTYDMYMIVGQNVSSSDSARMQAQIYLGGSLQTSSLYGYVAGAMDTSWVISTWTNPSDTRIILAETGYINTGGTPDRNFIFYCPNVNSTTKAHGFWGTGQENRTTARPHVYHMSGNYASIGSAMTGVRFYMATGTITGTFRLYGLKNS